MAIKTFTSGSVLTAADTNTYLANSGLVYIAEGSTSTSVLGLNFNNVFTTTYDNYRIMIDYFKPVTAARFVALQLRVGGFDTATNYYYAYRGIYTDGTSADLFATAALDMGMTFNPSKARIALVGLICMTVLIASRRNRTRPRLTDHHNDRRILSRKRHGRTKQQTSRANHPQKGPQIMAAKKKTPAAAGATLYPVLPIIKPTDLTGQQNGYLTANILRTIQKPSGQLEKHAATAWNCLQLAAYFNGLTLNQVGAYRTYDRQLAMFNDRYSIKDYGRKPQVIRIWQGRKYYLKPGKAPSSTPGNSDHGLGLAIDAANCYEGSALLAWLLGDGFAPPKPCFTALLGRSQTPKTRTLSRGTCSTSRATLGLQRSLKP
jgi:LAS superfamily LD-carboxypeptidase LdcB